MARRKGPARGGHTASNDSNNRNHGLGERHAPAMSDKCRPPPPPPPPPPDMYQFRGHASREHERHTDGSQNGGFNFSMPGPRFDQPPRGAPDPWPSRAPPRGPNPKRDTKRNQYMNRGQGARGGWKKRGANDRMILRSKRDTTPERLDGMGTGTDFKALDDLSDSEAEMDLSGNDESDDRPSKRKRVDPSTLDEVPKWSNPDPYTSLPPPDAAKKKDMVKLIRKAKMDAEAAAAPQDAAAANTDFISFDDFEDEGEIEDSLVSPSNASSVVGSSSRQLDAERFSHLDNLHPERLQPSSRSLAERVEKPPVQAGEKAHVRISVSQNKQDRGSKSDQLEQVSLDRWPPSSSRDAVASSKRRLDLGDDEPPPPPPTTRGRVPQDGPPGSKKRKRFAPQPLDGSVHEEWQALPGTDRTPWCTADHSAIQHMGTWLHREVRDFFDYARPYHFEGEIREELILRVSRALSRFERGGELWAFGSFAAGIYLPTADLDLVFISQAFYNGGYPRFGLTKKWMYNAMAHLVREGVAKHGGDVIFGAKVPILKIVDPVTDLKMDISFENMTGVTANATFRKWKDEQPAMPVLVTVIKQFLLMRGMNEVHTGGIGGFTVTCLVMSLLQHMPAVQSGDMLAEEHLGEILMEFFDLYGNKFNYRTTGIDMSPPNYFAKHESAKKDRLMVIDPNRRDNDISGGSHKVQIVFDAFKAGYKALQRRMAELEGCSPDQRRNASILDAIIGGNYTLFRQQRDHLKRLWDRPGKRPSAEDAQRMAAKEDRARRLHVMPEVHARTLIAIVSPTAWPSDGQATFAVGSAYPALFGERKVPTRLGFQNAEGPPWAADPGSAQPAGQKIPLSKPATTQRQLRSSNTNSGATIDDPMVIE